MTLERGRFRGTLLGLAIGDAVGAGFDLEDGRWTDATSMALCLAESLIACEGMNLQDQMERYIRWYRRGVWSSKGYCFGIGDTTRAALERFETTGDPLSGSEDPQSAGNGSILRLAPVAMFFARDRERAIAAARESSRTTHQTRECVDACAVLGARLVDLLHGDKGDLSAYGGRPGSAYVVESLNAATWAFANGNSFEECVLLAANLGTAAITGQMAGAYFGVRDIPEHWRRKCYRAAEIAGIADRLYELAAATGIDA